MEGKTDTDIALQEGDIIMVPPYVSVATVSGNVKRPMSYELLGGETLATLIDYAGGFTSDSYRDDFRLIRQTGPERQIFNVNVSQIQDFRMEDGDYVTVGASLDRFANKVEVRGYVFRPGMFELGKEISTVRQLVAGAGGLKEDAFTDRAYIMREKDDLSLETVTVNLGRVLDGSVPDVALRKNDILVISGIHEIKDRGTLSINGFVASPGTFPFAENTTIEDLILQAGGLLEGASLARVDVARRMIDTHSLEPTDVVGETYSFELKDGLVQEDGEFVLMPYDVVTVRHSPGYRVQQFVTISGEIAFPGEYVILNMGERISEVIKRAGGVTDFAYLRGATLSRQMNEEELNLNWAKQRISDNMLGRDSLATGDMLLSSNYMVGLELDKALQNPGSEYDMILRAGDKIHVPEQLSTVRISGDVMYPNTVSYVPGKSLGYYIDAAGGYGFRARRSKTMIIYMNGMSKRATLGARIEPGCEIVVPQKPDRSRMSASELLAIGSSATSLATMVATLVTLFTR